MGSETDQAIMQDLIVLFTHVHQGQVSWLGTYNSNELLPGWVVLTQYRKAYGVYTIHGSVHYTLFDYCTTVH